MCPGKLEAKKNFAQNIILKPYLSLMRSLKIYILALASLLIVSQHVAAAEEASSRVPNAMENKSANKNDKWFFYFGVGIVPQPKFDSGIQSNIDTGKQTNSWSGEYGGVLELPGIYYRVGASTIVGLIGNFIFENYARDFRDGQSLGYDTYNISASAMTSTGDQPGIGYFARLDVGPCDLVQISESANIYNRSYFPGAFEQIALGYGFQSSSNTRMLVHINTFYEDVIAHYQTGISVNIGIFL